MVELWVLSLCPELQVSIRFLPKALRPLPPEGKGCVSLLGMGRREEENIISDTLKSLKGFILSIAKQFIRNGVGLRYSVENRLEPSENRVGYPLPQPTGISLLCENPPFLALSWSLATKTWNPPPGETLNSLSLNPILYLAFWKQALRIGHRKIRSRTPGAPTSCPLWVPFSAPHPTLCQVPRLPLALRPEEELAGYDCYLSSTLPQGLWMPK